ncbi:cilia- and flagella-associated protein 299 [Drosophila busckii]|uniref:cilia- and flagella-associated protein 299 n=1 Tax=Drosophila busckii TaxID=30019 RepID=UPI00083EC229|nr:cilia- and flagella-associated protein 299 [Drosophila busckii]
MSLLQYNSYEQYVDHFISINDVRYLRNWKLSREFIQNACSKSCMGRLLSRQEYIDQRNNEEGIIKPLGISAVMLFGSSYKGNDRVLQQFAAREQLLLNKKVSTIIFLITRSSKGLEISGFIDLEQCFRESRFRNSEHYVDWPAIFEGKAKLTPHKHHLSYFEWNTSKVRLNDSDNFKVVQEGAHSLLMMHRGDHKMICVNPGCFCSFAKNATRSMHNSSIYGHCIFFDHVIRRSI